MFSELRPETNWDIWMLPFPNRTPQPYVRTRFFEGARAVSPDGRWLTYYSDESGRGEVYVRGFPDAGGKWLISTDGGAESVWSRNGRELFYRSGRKLMVVDVTLQPTFAASKPRMLFEGPYVVAPVAEFDVSADGQQFVMVMPSQTASQVPRIEMVLNWFEELKARVPTK